MIQILFVSLVLGAACYLGLRLPKSVESMTEEEYEKYFRTHIMGME